MVEKLQPISLKLVLHNSSVKITNILNRAWRHDLWSTKFVLSVVNLQKLATGHRYGYTAARVATRVSYYERRSKSNPNLITVK